MRNEELDRLKQKKLVLHQFQGTRAVLFTNHIDYDKLASAFASCKKDKATLRPLLRIARTARNEALKELKPHRNYYKKCERTRESAIKEMSEALMQELRSPDELSRLLHLISLEKLDNISHDSGAAILNFKSALQDNLSTTNIQLHLTNIFDITEVSCEILSVLSTIACTAKFAGFFSAEEHSDAMKYRKPLLDHLLGVYRTIDGLYKEVSAAVQSAER